MKRVRLKPRRIPRTTAAHGLVVVNVPRSYKAGYLMRDRYYSDVVRRFVHPEHVPPKDVA